MTVNTIMSWNTLARWIGILAWIAAGIGLAVYASGAGERPDRSGSAVTGAVFQRGQPLRLVDRSAIPRIGDPVFSDFTGTSGGTDRDWRQVGYVTSVNRERGIQSGDRNSEQGDIITVQWFGEETSPERLHWTAHRTTGSLQEVAEVMLPRSRRKELEGKLKRLVEQHGKQIAESLAPLIRQTMIESIPIVEIALTDSIGRHREQWERLGRRWETEILQERLLPLAKEEMLPIVREHGQPLAEQIGRELWERASLWRFGWRALYDRTPLPDREMVRGEWQRFVDEEAVPVFENHFDEIAETLIESIRDIAANPRVRLEFRELADRLAEDQEARTLLKQTLREALVDNEDLRQRWASIWNSPTAKRAVREAGKKIEPTIRQIGDDLLGTPERGIDPRFARVLRNQILGKDRRWLVARRPENDSEVGSERGVIRRADRPMTYPKVYLATP